MNTAREHGERLNAAMPAVVEQARWNAKFRSVRALAEAAGMTHTYLNNRLSGSVIFSIRDLGALGHALGVPVAELLDRAKALADASEADDSLRAAASTEAELDPGDLEEQ